MSDADVWADGAMTLKAAGEYLGGLSRATMRRLVSAEGWPAKKVGARAVYPAKLVKQFLAGCPAAPKRRAVGK